MKNTIDILLFIVKQKNNALKTMLSISNWLSLVAKIAMLFCLLLNLIIISEILKDAKPADIKNVFIILLLVFLVIGIIKEFIPSYTPQANYLPATLPISFVKRSLIRLSVELYSFYSLCIVLFFGAFAFVFQLFSSAYLILVLLLLIFLINYFLKNILESNFKDVFSWLSMVGFIFISYSANHFLKSLDLTWLISFGFLLFCYGISPIFQAKAGLEQQTKVMNIFGWNIIFNNPSSRVTILMYMVLKIAFFIFIEVNKSKLKEVPMFLAVLALISSSAMLFTYLFNNLFGFLKEYWLSIFLIDGRIKKLIQFYFKLILPFLLFDFLLYTIEVGSHKLPSYCSIALYLVQTVTFINVSLYGALLSPMKVKKSSLFNTNSTSLPINLCFITIAYGGAFLYVNGYNLYNYILLIGINLLLMLRFNKSVKDYQYRFYSKVFK